MAKKSGHFVFRKGDTVGAADAENDEFLEACFIDNGDVEILRDCNDRRCIVVGRTGSGKSAALLAIERLSPEHTLRVSAEDLSVNHIANSDLLHQVTSLNVSLDPFFKLLWREVLAVELLQHIKPITQADKPKGIQHYLRYFFKDAKDKAERYERVIAAIDKFSGSEFWGDIGTKAVSMVVRLENEIKKSDERKSSIGTGADAAVINTASKIGENHGRQSKQSESVEIHIEDKRRYQRIVNEMHIRELEEIIPLVSDVFQDCGHDTYVIIDKLDLQWADESIRLRLIRALIDTAIAFTGARRVKIVIALRIDLLERVFRDSRHEPGTQWEKLKDYFVTLDWSKKALTELLDRRIGVLARDGFVASYRPTHKDIMNPTLKKGRSSRQSTLDYLLDRTWNRPRDVIDFVNGCIARSAHKAKISEVALLEAEGEYSRGRLVSLAEEWQLEYPFLDETVKKLIRERPRRFVVQDIADELLIDWSHMVRSMPMKDGDRLRALANSLEEDARSYNEVRAELATILYRTGIVGIQTDQVEAVHWATNLSYTLSSSEVRQDSLLYVHDGLWKALGVKLGDADQNDTTRKGK